MERACLAARERPTEQQAASYLATSGPRLFLLACCRVPVPSILMITDVLFTTSTKAVRLKNERNLSVLKEVGVEIRDGDPALFALCTLPIAVPWCAELPFPAALPLTPPALPEYALNSWMNLSSNSAAPPSPVDMRNVNEVHFPFFLAKLRSTCKHATSIWSLVTSLLHSTKASWKVFALLIFSEISETGTKNSSPPPSVTSDRTIALTMESIRCVALH